MTPHPDYLAMREVVRRIMQTTPLKSEDLTHLSLILAKHHPVNQKTKPEAAALH